MNKICLNCKKTDTCKASRTMKDYKHPVPCVWYDQKLDKYCLKSFGENMYINEYI